MADERTLIYHERPQICPRCGHSLVWDAGGHEHSSGGLCHCTLCTWRGEWYATDRLGDMYAELQQRAARLEHACREALHWLGEYQERYHLVDEPPIARLLRAYLDEEW